MVLKLVAFVAYVPSTRQGLAPAVIDGAELQKSAIVWTRLFAMRRGWRVKLQF